MVLGLFFDKGRAEQCAEPLDLTYALTVSMRLGRVSGVKLFFLDLGHVSTFRLNIRATRDLKVRHSRLSSTLTGVSVSGEFFVFSWRCVRSDSAVIADFVADSAAAAIAGQVSFKPARGLVLRYISEAEAVEFVIPPFEV